MKDYGIYARMQINPLHTLYYPLKFRCPVPFERVIFALCHSKIPNWQKLEEAASQVHSL